MKVLVIRFSAIGDCVMTAYAVTALRKRCPDADIHWLVEPRCAPVIAKEKLVEQEIHFERARWKKAPLNPRTIREQLVFYVALRRQGYDWGIDFQGHSKTAICLRLALPKKRLMARATDALAAKLNPLLPGNSRSMHTVEWNHHALCQFGDFPFLREPIVPQWKRPAGAPSSEFLTLSVGAGAKNKEWPLERWQALARQLVQEGIPVVALGGPTDPPLAIATTMDLVGTIPLGETMAWVAHSRVHVSADTGTGHMAAAYRIPAISLFGPSPASVFRPYAETSVVIDNGPDMTSISVDEVFEQTLDQWRKGCSAF